MSLPAPTSGTQEYSFIVGKDASIIYSNSQNSLDDWICQYKGVHCLFYFVDICSYDRPTLEDSGITEMTKSLALFNTLANSESLKDTAVVLCFTNQEFFKSRLVSSPLKTQFLDYSGGNKVCNARTYITWCFRKVLGKERGFFTRDLRKHRDRSELEETSKWFSRCISEVAYNIKLR
jgi:hypothetical protein